MSSFDQVFERIKSATNTRTQVELAEVLGIRQSSISDAKRRNSVPADWYLKLFEQYGLNPDWLKIGQGPMYLKSEEGYQPYDGPAALSLREEAAHYAEPESKGIVVNVHSMQSESETHEGYEPKSIGKLNVPRSLAPSSILVVKVEGSSMEPYIRRGAYVGIDQSKKNVVSGEIFGVFVPYEGLLLKRVFLDADRERIVLRSENQAHPETEIHVDKAQERIVGRAVWVMQEL